MKLNLQPSGNQSISQRISMDDLFEDKFVLLQLYYPDISPEVLRDFLLNCGNDLDATRSLIDGKPRAKKRPTASAQAVLSSFTRKRSKTDVKHTSEAKKEKISSVASSNVGSSAKSRNVSEIITLNTPSDVRENLHPYASLHLNFLPENICSGVQEDLIDTKAKFGTNKFYLFGNQCESNHTTGMFCRPSAEYSRLVYNGLCQSNLLPYSENMEKAAQFLERFLNEKVIPSSERLVWQLKEPWTNDFSVVNCYEKLQNYMDWHSDRLSHMGPHNYVASISLGATRMFRLRSTYKEHGPIYQIPLPHNSLFIMGPGCQEEFRHCLNPMSKSVDVHPTLGSLRLGITARCYPASFIVNSPQCKCGIGMLLRRSHKTLANRGKYFWSCENVYQNKGCSSFHWCDFTNVKGHFIAKDETSTSVWIAPEDTEKLIYEKNKIKAMESEN